MFPAIDGANLAVAQAQAEAFEESCRLGLDREIFIREYMNSRCARLMDLQRHKIGWNGNGRLLSRFMTEKEIPQGDVWDEDVMFWIDYTYRIWHSLTGQPSREIYDMANAKVMLVNFRKCTWTTSMRP